MHIFGGCYPLADTLCRYAPAGLGARDRKHRRPPTCRACAVEAILPIAVHELRYMSCCMPAEHSVNTCRALTGWPPCPLSRDQLAASVVGQDKQHAPLARASIRVVIRPAVSCGQAAGAAKGTMPRPWHGCVFWSSSYESSQPCVLFVTYMPQLMQTAHAHAHAQHELRLGAISGRGRGGRGGGGGDRGQDPHGAVCSCRATIHRTHLLS